MHCIINCTDSIIQCMYMYIHRKLRDTTVTSMITSLCHLSDNAMASPNPRVSYGHFHSPL